MDLSTIQDALDTFADFAGAIGDFIQIPAQILSDLFGTEADLGGDVDQTSGLLTALSSTDEA